MITKTQTIFALAAVLIILSCNSDYEQIPQSFSPKVLKAEGYVVPKDSMAEPKVIPAGRPRVVRAGKPKVVLTNTNVHPAGIPKVVIAGTPKVCTPGQDGFSLPKTVPAIDSPFMAGTPEVVIAGEAYTKDQNPQNFSSFGKLQGLKSAEITCLLEDKRGNLWIGAQGGVSKYDGKSFTQFTTEEGLGLNAVVSMLEDKSGNLWFGTTGFGVIKYDGQRFTHFTVKEGLSENTVWSMLEDKRGNVWFGTGNGGVDKYNGKSFTHFTIKEGLSNNAVLSILEDKSGNLWFGTDAGVSKYDGKSFTNFTEKEGLGNNGVSSILEDKRGNFWFGTGAGVSKYDGKSFTHFTEKEGLSGYKVTSILEDKSGNLWFTTYGGGVCKYDGKSFTHFTEKEGLGDDRVNSILKDKRGNLWFATNGGGVSKYGGKRFTHFTVEEGLSDNVVKSILEDKSGNLWFGTWEGGVSKYDGRSFTHFTMKEGMRSNAVRSILEDKRGNLWFGDYTGIAKYDGKSFTHFAERDMDVFSIMEDKSGNLWFATYESGVIKYDGKSFTHFTMKEGLSNNMVAGILEDKSGNLWFATYGGGLSKYDGKSFTHFTERGGLINNRVLSILEDKTGNLWFGTAGGLSKYDGNTFTNFTEKEGLSNNHVVSILEDKSGNLWFGADFGVSKLEKDRLASFTKVMAGEATSGKRESTLLFKTYTYEDGFSGVKVNLGKTIYEARDGTIWIGAGDRLTVFHPGEESLDTTAPNIQITGITLSNENIAWQNLMSPWRESSRRDNYREGVKDTNIVLSNGVKLHDFHFDSVSKWYGLPENLSLLYTNNYLTFQFVGITIQSPKKVKYQYKLEGLDKNWSTLTNRSEAPYSNLPYGNYTFKVKAMNGDGYWSKEFHYSFTIRPPWSRTWWAYFSYILVFSVSLWSFIKLRVRVLKKEKVMLEEKVAVRTYELRNEKEKVASTLSELKATQTQLIEAEKMASVTKLNQAMLHERLRISRELHDDIGSALSGIVLYSHVMESQVQAQQPGEVENSVNKIQQSAHAMVNRLNDLVWAVNPEHNTLINLMQKLKDYAVEIATVKNIKLQMNVPGNLAELQLPVESLHNIYLFCKEAINNAVKYSQASVLELGLHQFDHTIKFSITDNGKGFDMATVKKGNGLRNMHKRADEAAAILSVQSTPQEGTVISLECKIT